MFFERRTLTRRKGLTSFSFLVINTFVLFQAPLPPVLEAQAICGAARVERRAERCKRRKQCQNAER